MSFISSTDFNSTINSSSTSKSNLKSSPILAPLYVISIGTCDSTFKSRNVNS